MENRKGEGLRRRVGDEDEVVEPRARAASVRVARDGHLLHRCPGRDPGRLVRTRGRRMGSIKLHFLTRLSLSGSNCFEDGA
jgi:hypothetical protein